jgi:hypothetical protein
VPITIDGQPLCEDLTPLEQPIADALQTVTDTVQTVTDAVNTQVQPAEETEREASLCTRLVSSSSRDAVYVPVSWHTEPNYYDQYGDLVFCDGYVLTITPTAEVGTTTVHVPQVCLTTTGTCLGPADPAVPDHLSVATVCITGHEWIMSKGGTLWFEADEQGPVDDRCLYFTS